MRCARRLCFLALAKADGENADKWPRAAMSYSLGVGRGLFSADDAERLTKAYLLAKAEAAVASAKAEAYARAHDAKGIKSTVSTLRSFAAMPVVALGEGFFAEVLAARDGQEKAERKRTILALYAANVALTRVAKDMAWLTSDAVRVGFEALPDREAVVSRWCGKSEAVAKSEAQKFAEACDTLATKVDGENSLAFNFLSGRAYDRAVALAVALRDLSALIEADEKEIRAERAERDAQRAHDMAAHEKAETARALKQA